MSMKTPNVRSGRDLTTPPRMTHAIYLRPHRYRVRCRILLLGKPRATACAPWREAGFTFPTLQKARRHYKTTLLSLYRRKDVASFTIILNHLRDEKWENPIHAETVFASEK